MSTTNDNQTSKPKKKRNCLVYLLILVIVIIVGFGIRTGIIIFQAITNTSNNLSNTPAQSGNSDTSWFSGGTLHNSTIGEWRKATYSNRLATSADFIAATQNVDYGDLVKFKQMSTNLETCISTAASSGNVDNEKVTFVSSMCIVELFPK